MFRRTATSTLRSVGPAAVAASVGAILAASASFAHAGEAKASCPAGYDLIVTTPSYCLSKMGDVVEPDVERQSLSCPKGYDRLARLCLSSVTGDVVLASEEDIPPRALRADRAGLSK